MFPELNACKYNYVTTLYVAEFEVILSKIIACYHMMVSGNIRVESHENKIRNVIVKNYLNNNTIRKQLQLTCFLFDREVPEDNDLGRTDIKIQTLDTFKDTAAYYIIECKRLDTQNPNGTSGLNGEYVSSGIRRFVTRKYSSYNNTNGMLGFIVQPMDIHGNVTCINTLLSNPAIQANTRQNIQQHKLVDDFEYSYCSTHTMGQNQITLYHLMLDFSSNILF